MTTAGLLEAVRTMVARLPAMQAVLPPLTEADTCGGVVEPILRALGWDTVDVLQVRRQYRHGTGDNPVDYGLFLDGVPVLFVEAKAMSGDLDDPRWRNQTLGYAYHANVAWCALTNGTEWRLYKTMAPGDAASRLFRQIRLEDAEAPETLSLIGPVAIQRGAASRLWEAEYADRLVRPAYEAAVASRRFVQMVRDLLTEPLPLDAVQTALQRIGLPTASATSADARTGTVESNLPSAGTSNHQSTAASSTPPAAEPPRRWRGESITDLLADGRLRAGQAVRIRRRPGSEARIVDGRTVEHRGRTMTWNAWGNEVTGWPTINIYAHAETTEGRLLDDLRRDLRGV